MFWGREIFDKVFGEGKKVESNVILKAMDQEKVGSKRLEEHNPYKFEGKVIQQSTEGIFEDEQITLNFRDQVHALETTNSKYVDFLGVDASV